MKTSRVAGLAVLAVASISTMGTVQASGQAVSSAGAPADTPATIVDVVDGDTLEVSINGQIERVRLIGIDVAEADTPCGDAVTGFVEAALHVGDEIVLRAGAVDDRDRYDRLLRYVEITNPNEDPLVAGDETADLGGFLLGGGLAEARYNSTDGYGRHTLEDSYETIEVDAPVLDQCGANAIAEQPQPQAQPQQPAQPQQQAVTQQHAQPQQPLSAPPPAPQPEPEPAAGGGGGCHPNYSPCIPNVGDLDCGEIGFTVTVSGGDPYRLDRDSDGLGCE